MWAQELHPGDACLPQVPAVLGRHMAGGPSRNQTGGWLTTLCVLLLPEEAALKAWKSVKTGCLQSSWEEIPGGRHMTKGGPAPWAQPLLCRKPRQAAGRQHSEARHWGPGLALPQPAHATFSSWAQGCLPMSLCQTPCWPGACERLRPLGGWQPKLGGCHRSQAGTFRKESPRTVAAHGTPHRAATGDGEGEMFLGASR